MKVLIQDADSQLYLGHQYQWFDAAQEARDFAFTAYARKVALGLRLRHFQIVFFIPATNQRIVVAEPESSGETNLANA